MGTTLTTLEEYKKLPPRAQGFVAYMEAAWPGSELKGHDGNPYPQDSADWREWRDGQERALIAVIDMEE